MGKTDYNYFGCLRLKKGKCLICCIFGKKVGNTQSVSRTFPGGTGYIFLKVFSDDSSRKRLTLSQLFPWKTLCLFLCMYSGQTENMFATFLTGKRVRFIPECFPRKQITCFPSVSPENIHRLALLLAHLPPERATSIRSGTLRDSYSNSIGTSRLPLASLFTSSQRRISVYNSLCYPLAPQQLRYLAHGCSARQISLLLAYTALIITAAFLHSKTFQLYNHMPRDCFYSMQCTDLTYYVHSRKVRYYKTRQDSYCLQSAQNEYLDGQECKTHTMVVARNAERSAVTICDRALDGSRLGSGR